MRKLLLTTICLLLSISMSLAQTDNAKKSKSAGADKKAAAPAGAPQMPQPAPELKRFNYFVGDWTTEGTMEPGPFGPGGKFAGKDHFSWFGRYFLVSNSTSTMAGMGNMKEMALFGYDTEKKAYTYHAVSTMGGDAEESSGTVNGADWTWTNDVKMNGKTWKNKFVLHEDSPTHYTMKLEYSEDGGKTWKPGMTASATKAAAAGAAAK